MNGKKYIELDCKHAFERKYKGKNLVVCDLTGDVCSGVCEKFRKDFYFTATEGEEEIGSTISARNTEDAIKQFNKKYPNISEFVCEEDW